MSQEQTCPKCGLIEAAGGYCSRCGTKTGYDLWHATRRSPAQRDALRRSKASRSKERSEAAL